MKKYFNFNKASLVVILCGFAQLFCANQREEADLPLAANVCHPGVFDNQSSYRICDQAAFLLAVQSLAQGSRFSLSAFLYSVQATRTDGSNALTATVEQCLNAANALGFVPHKSFFPLSEAHFQTKGGADVGCFAMPADGSAAEKYEAALRSSVADQLEATFQVADFVEVENFVLPPIFPEWSDIKGKDQLLAAYQATLETFANADIATEIFPRVYMPLGMHTTENTPEKSAEFIWAIQSSIASGNPVVLGMNTFRKPTGLTDIFTGADVFEEYLSIGTKDGKILDLPNPDDGFNVIVTHAVTVIGYNKDGLVCVNPWGMNHHEGGTFIMGYNYAAKAGLVAHSIFKTH